MLEQYQIATPDPKLQEQVQANIDIKTKPPGSLGEIETLALQLACAQNTLSPRAEPAELIIFAGDHGLVEEGVSAWPSEVTTQMVANFLAGGAAANVFARTNGLSVSVVDAGILGDLPNSPDLLRANIKKGTANAMHSDAMTMEETLNALEFGAEMASSRASAGTRVFAFGEMGIGNTSAATLLAHAIHQLDITVLSGPGAGLDDKGVARKAEILTRVASRRPAPLAPIDALSAFGGLEIAAMTGAMIGAASRKAIVLVDGFIASSAAMVALAARPEIRPYLIFAHQSEEPGHNAMMEAMQVSPLLTLHLRLGEGTGALLAYPLVKCASAMLNEMATFESAGVSGKEN